MRTFIVVSIIGVHEVCRLQHHKPELATESTSQGVSAVRCVRCSVFRCSVVPCSGVLCSWRSGYKAVRGMIPMIVVGPPKSVTNRLNAVFAWPNVLTLAGIKADLQHKPHLRMGSCL